MNEPPSVDVADPKVIRLIPRDGEPSPFTKKPPDGQMLFCRHRALWYDPVARTLECRHCGQPVDPFEAVLIFDSWAREMDWKWKAIQEAEQKLRDEAQEKRDARAIRQRIAMQHGRRARQDGALKATNPYRLRMLRRAWDQGWESEHAQTPGGPST